MERKSVAFFELILVLTSLFSFSYIVAETEYYYGSGSMDINRADGLLIQGVQYLISKFSEPMIPVVSASNHDQISLPGSGCCRLADNGDVCSVKEPESCVLESGFAEGAVCGETSFCQRGCCYDEDIV